MEQAMATLEVQESSTLRFVRDAYFSKAHGKRMAHNILRLVPLFTALVAPLTVLYDIPALSQPWYGKESQALTDETTSLVLSSLSLALNITANALLLVRFSVASPRKYTLATRLSMVFWILKAVVATVNLIVFGATRNNTPDYEYLQGFWCAVVSCVLSSLSAILLFAHYLYEFDPNVALKNNEVRLRGRGLMLNVTFLICSVGIQGLVFSRIEKWTYLDGIYFSTVSVLTVGFGDLEPTTTAGKIVLFPLVLLGITQLAVIVSELIDFSGEKTLDIVQVTNQHILRESLRKQADRESIDLNQEIKFLEKVQRAEDNRDELISLAYSLASFITLWIIGALIFSQLEGWTFGNGLYFNYVFFLTLGYGDYAPTTAASRVVFIVYALISVPIITSFAVQSIAKAMSLLSERRLARHTRKVRRDPKPVPHHVLVENARADLVKQAGMMGLEELLVDIVLKMDLSTRKIMSVALVDHNKLLMKADTLVQLRNSHYDHQDFVEAFHNVHISTELATYREQFARFLATASAIKNLQGEERRTFERRLHVKELEADAEEGRDEADQELDCDSSRRSQDNNSKVSTEEQARGRLPGSASGDTLGYTNSDDLQRQDSKDTVTPSNSSLESSQASDRRRRIKGNVLQSKGLVDKSKQKNETSEEGDY